jgi:hypothetical protein
MTLSALLHVRYSPIGASSNFRELTGEVRGIFLLGTSVNKRIEALLRAEKFTADSSGE